MSTEEWDDITPQEEEGLEEDSEQEIEEVEEQDESEDSQKNEKYDRLTRDDSRRYKLSGMYRNWFLDYASYVILSRAVPDITDGLKPVQRRILHSMFKDDTGELTKVANIVGRVMAYHPHGDASITDALVTIGQKGLLVDCQGNWGDPITGSSNAAMRYIEGRLSKFAKEVVFDPKITEWMSSYDGKNQEPVALPIRFPLMLAEGTAGIAVGLSTLILPHNFNELIDASINILQGKDFEIYPDFFTGGYADVSRYMKGRRGGVVKVRAKIEKIDKNTIAIREIPFSKTTESLIETIIAAQKKGKIKIRKIENMTSSEVNIIIYLPNDVSPDKTIDALYACTACEVRLSPNACVIKDNKPEFMDVHEILRYNTEHTKELIGRELDIRKNELEDAWHYNSLEKIFFENRVYKILEQDQKSWEMQLEEVFAKMKEYSTVLKREILMDDILKLVEKPVRKISKFDAKVVDEKIRGIEQELSEVQYNIDHLTEYTIEHFRNIKKKYGQGRERKTELTNFENIAVTKVVSNNAKLYANLADGFVGLEPKKIDGGEFICDCSDMSEVLAIGKDGKYSIRKVKDKDFFSKDLLYVGIFNRNDERTIYNVIYREGKSSVYYAKRFAITSVTRDKEYDITSGKEDSKIVWFSANHNGEAETVKINLKPRPKLKKAIFEYDFSTLAIKGKNSRGNLVSKFQIQRISLKSKGISTIGGKEIWYDADVQRLNEDGRGTLLGQFNGEDKILAIFRDGTYYTTSFDLSNRYQGEVLKIEKFEEGKTYTALYFDGASKCFYVKRFSFVINDNSPMGFISDARGSYLVALSEDRHPQVLVTFGGKYVHREAEKIDAEEFIGKKGLTAKGKRCHQYELSKVEFIEPLHKPEDDMEEKPTDIMSSMETENGYTDESEANEPEIQDGGGNAGDGNDDAGWIEVEDESEPSLFD